MCISCVLTTFDVDDILFSGTAYEICLFTYLLIFAVVWLVIAAPFVMHCLSEKKKLPDENSRTVYQPYKHLQNSLETNGSDGPPSVEMTALLDDRGSALL